MKLLAIDTATPRLVVGLARGAERWHRELDSDPQARGGLPAMVSALLSEAGLSAHALDGVAVGVGPGSFAGLRGGMAFARALAWALDRPVVPVGSLECIAAPFLQAEGPIRRVRVMLDARMQAVYTGDYTGGTAAPEALAPIAERGLAPCAAELREAAASDTALVGNALALPECAGLESMAWGAFDATALPCADAMLEIALARAASGGWIRADALQPVYIRNRVALTREQRSAGEQLQAPG